jgi:putative transposase
MDGTWVPGTRSMRPSRFSYAEILQALAQVRAGTPALHVCRALGITQTTFYRWRAKHDGVAVKEEQEVDKLRTENHALKQIVAELLLAKLA